MLEAGRSGLRRLRADGGAVSRLGTPSSFNFTNKLICKMASTAEPVIGRDAVPRTPHGLALGSLIDPHYFGHHPAFL
jgi:hypothetical protein